MKAGKIPEYILKRSVLKPIRHRREEVEGIPAIGKDGAILSLQQESKVVFSSEAMTFDVQEKERIAIHLALNGLAAAWAKPVGILLNILLPVSEEESTLRKMMHAFETVCEELHIEILGGHTEAAVAINRPVVTVTAVGVQEKKDVRRVHASCELVMTKWAGLEGTVLLAREKAELKERYPSSFIEEAADMIKDISVLPEAEIAREMGVLAMHDVSKGGIFGALWEIGAVHGLGMEVDLKKIPVRQETIEICEYFDYNPYTLASGGAMLFIAEHGNELKDALEARGISAEVIGRMTEGNDRLLINGEEKRYMEPPKEDDIYKAFV